MVKRKPFWVVQNGQGAELGAKEHLVCVDKLDNEIRGTFLMPEKRKMRKREK